MTRTIAALAATLAAWLSAGADANATPPRDDARTLRAVTPTGLLAPGESQFHVFLNAYTQTDVWNADGDRVDQGGRSTYVTAISSVTLGWKPTWNLGLDVLTKHVRDDRFADADRSRTAVTAVIPHVVTSPFASLPRFAVETGVSLPAASDLDGADGRPFLDYGDPAWIVKLYSDAPIGEYALAYLETGGVTRFAGDGAQLETPLRVFLNAYVSERWTVTAPIEATVRWVNDGAEDWYSQVGVGAKFQPGPRFEIEAIVTVFPAGRNTGAGSTANLGFRLLR